MGQFFEGEVCQWLSVMMTGWLFHVQRPYMFGCLSGSPSQAVRAPACLPGFCGFLAAFGWIIV